MPRNMCFPPTVLCCVSTDAQESLAEGLIKLPTKESMEALPLSLQKLLSSELMCAVCTMTCFVCDSSLTWTLVSPSEAQNAWRQKPPAGKKGASEPETEGDAGLPVDDEVGDNDSVQSDPCDLEPEESTTGTVEDVPLPPRRSLRYQEALTSNGNPFLSNGLCPRVRV